MTKRGWAILACVAGTVVACGGAKQPAESPPSETPPVTEDTAPEAQIESGPVTTSGDEASPESPTIKQELPCPGKKARYWDSGLVKSEVLTSDCEVNGQSYQAGTLLQFDEDGQLLPAE